MSFRNLLVHTCTIIRKRKLTDAQGNPILEDGTPTWITETQTGIKCRLERNSTGAQYKDGNMTIITNETLILPPEVDIRQGDIVEVNGSRYRALRPEYISGFSLHHIEVPLDYQGEA